MVGVCSALTLPATISAASALRMQMSCGEMLGLRRQAGRLGRDFARKFDVGVGVERGHLQRQRVRLTAEQVAQEQIDDEQQHARRTKPPPRPGSATGSR